MTEALTSPLSLQDLWMHLPLLNFIQPRSIWGGISLSLRAMTIYSTSWFVGNVCRLFAQMYAALRMFYGFFVRLCTAFAYTAFAYVCERLLRTLCGFCVRIRLIFCTICATSAYVYVFLWVFSRFCVHIRLFCALWAAFEYGYGFLIPWKSWWSNPESSLICWKSQWSNLEGLLICWMSRWSDIEGSLICLKYRWSDIEGSLICWKSVLTVVMIGPSRGSVWRILSSGFLVRRSARYDWTVWRILSSGFRWVISPTILTRFTVQSYLIKFLSNDLLVIHHPILPWTVSCWSCRSIYNPVD